MIFKKFKDMLAQLFTAETEQEKLDAFIIKHDPQTVHEVEYWTRVYDERRFSR